MRQSAEHTIECDIAIIGGGMGGVAAALAASKDGKRVVLTEETGWLGGQMTSGGVSAFDEHQYIETFGGTKTYNHLRNQIRKSYQEKYNVPSSMPNGNPLNPGNGWVSRLCFEPGVGVRVLNEMLAPYVDIGALQIFRLHKPVDVERTADRILLVQLKNNQGQLLDIAANYFIDATELGDVLHLAGMNYFVGAESKDETGEPHAPDKANPNDVQSFTYSFAVDYNPGENHTISKPSGYEKFKNSQPYSLNISPDGITSRRFRMFESGDEGTLPFWTYRRIFDGKLLQGTGQQDDISLINWLGNDYREDNLIDKSPSEQKAVIWEAKNLSLGFLYWLQTECPRDDETGKGYPEIRLRPDVMQTSDGLSKYPYIRESRRISPLKQIFEQNISADFQSNARAAHFNDSVGIGWYHIDLHPSAVRTQSIYQATKPFQIPLGALIPKDVSNLIAGNKNIGTTHITNGAYRLHPVEWNIGESAGLLASYCCDIQKSLATIYNDFYRLKSFQSKVLNSGIPLNWVVDLPKSDPIYKTTQILLLTDVLSEDSQRLKKLEIFPNKPISEAVAKAMISEVMRFKSQQRIEDVVTITEALQSLGVSTEVSSKPTWREFCELLAPFLNDQLAA